MQYRMVLVALALAHACAIGQETGTIQGLVRDAETLRPLEAANILLQGTNAGVSAGKDGSFRLPRIPAGSYTVRVSFIGYSPQTLLVAVRQGETSTLDVSLVQTVLPGQSIVVSATRARERSSPVAFSTLSPRDLTERYSTQDIPLLLSELPSTTFYSESGNGIGYNYLSIRGFDQRRISVMVNGIPQNDPEDHDVYWLDFPDLAANLQDIQVQRGAGSAFYGPPAIGGSVNLITSSYSRTPGISVYTGFGSYNTRRYSVSVNSGLVGEKYQFYGRLSRILSDGYRMNSWTDFSSYFLGATRYDETMTTQLNFYGGPVADHLAYYGIAREDAYSSDSQKRRQNPIRRAEEIENFSQPHYELLHEWRPSEHITVNNALFLVTGDGFFDYDGSWAPYSYFRITPRNGFAVSGDPDELYIPNALIRAWVGNRQYGWLPRASIRHDGGEVTVGAEFRIHRSTHWGALRWGESLPAGITPDYHYYEYQGGKDMISLYVHELYELRPDLTLQLDLQYADSRYRFHDEKYLNTDFSVPYRFLNPRAGLNYNISEKLNIYTQISRTSREPRLKNLYDAAEASTPQSWGPVTPQFRTQASGAYDFSSPLVRPEALVDVELGSGYTAEQLHVTASLFYMSFDDEIIKQGQLDRFGIPVTGNADRTLHQGIELTAVTRFVEGLEVQANATWSRNRLEKYSVFNGSTRVSLDGNNIAGFPDFLANARATYRTGGLVASLSIQHVGEFYSDNFQSSSKGRTDPGRTISAYTVVHASLTYRLRLVPVVQSVEISAQANNLFNRMYAANGEGGEFYPAAERNYFASLKFDL
ncbi:MAG: TonB-dependent receptor [Ignavibacteriales bacterium]|nr:TonB-dependent receptor [Ignavibacteriales bacterium]